MAEARKPAAIMLQGTGSDVGKSLLAAGLCRAFRNRGLRVRPFKPQNMSNNAAIAHDETGQMGEIGRAQALQARAAGIAPQVHMNPVLLKPQTDVGAQVVVHGQILGNATAKEYVKLKPTLLPKVLQSFEAIGKDADLIIIEGAGSPAEVNLRASDIANMGFAEAADVPVLLVADIDRGGVIASVVGTYTLLPEPEQRRIKGYLINKFRGDPNLFLDGLTIITDRTYWPSLGVIPYFIAAKSLPKEDAFALENAGPNPAGGTRLKIAVPRLGRISNFDDLDPLIAEPDVSVVFVEPGSPLPGDADLIVLPGSKSTLADRDVLQAESWDQDILAHYRRGGAVVGLCGGFQLLGHLIRDPEGIEGPARDIAGLGLLDIETTMRPKKALVEQRGRDCFSHEEVQGYEMHIGVTTGPACEQPWFEKMSGEPEGAVSSDGLIFGTYLHGVFAADAFRHAFLARIAPDFRGRASFNHGVEQALDKLADHLEQHADLDQIFEIAKG